MTTDPFALPTELHPYPVNLDYSRQSVEVPGTRKPGQTGHYRSACFGLMNSETPGMLRDTAHIFSLGLHRSKDKPFLGRRPVLSTNPLKFADHYVWETYGQVDVRRRAVGSALRRLFDSGHFKAENLDTVGIWSMNRPEWQIVDLAVETYGMTSVALYDTLGKDAVEHIINHAHLNVIFATEPHIPSLLKLIPQCPCLKMIVSIDDLSDEAKSIASNWAQAQGIELRELRDIEADGRKNPLEPAPTDPKSVATICYTSGTTGMPKGVVLTQEVQAAAINAQLCGSTLTDGAMLSYLPLAHIYARLCELSVIAIGGSLGSFTGDPLRLLEDAQILKPVFFPSVPRVLNRIYQSAMVAGNVPGIRGALFKRAMDTKLQQLRTTGNATHAFWDRLVFRKIQAVLGGNIQMLSSGSAPITREVVEFLRIAFACQVIEGYGMTENGGTCTRIWPDDPTSSGTVGPPQSCVEIKLVDVPAMGYGAEDQPHPRGEIFCRGPGTFSQYYKDPENTKKTVDADGWVGTGDVGEIDSVGRLRIIDRVKNIMKLAQGEYVALEKVENLYSSHPLVAQLYVHGDSLQSFLLGVVVPDPVQLAALASRVYRRRVATDDGAALVAAARDPQIAAEIMKLLNKEAAHAKLKGFEMIKRIHVALDPFTVENGCLTPTMKIKRKDAYLKHKAELDALYALGESSSSPAKL